MRSLQKNKLRISVKPRRLVHLKLIVDKYQEKFMREWVEGKLKMGEIILNDYVIIPFKRRVEIANPSKAVALDFNETNITAVTSDGAYTFNTKEVGRLRELFRD